MFFTLKKLSRRVGDLGGRRYSSCGSIAPFISMEGDLPSHEHYHGMPEKIEGPLFGIGDFFVGRDRYLWLDKVVKVPEKRDGCEIVGLFDFGRTGDGVNDGFESLLYIDGQPRQGVDSHHNEVFFDEWAGKEIRITFMLWTGLEGYSGHTRMGPGGVYYHQCRLAKFLYLHKKTDALYYYAKVITEALTLTDKQDDVYEDLLGALDSALKGIDWDGPDFYETVDLAYEKLMDSLSHMKKTTDATIYAVGHSHIDVAWLWRLKHTREKAQRTFSTSLRLMERYDEFVFLQSQPQLYQYIKEDCPEIYAQIKERVAEGKWEPEGGMWVEADCNISSGEALVRQLLYGIRFIEQEFGKRCEYLWLPDVFGYSWALPQILKQCEIHTFMTTKISWNQYNGMPEDLFWWRGIDGSEILTYFMDVPVLPISQGHTGSTYGSSLSTRDVMQSWKAFKNKEISKDMLISFGLSDGGGGVTRNSLEMRRVMDTLPGLPHVKIGRAGDFFRQIHKKVEETERYVHTWDGELYLEFHRGTYTTQAYNKKTNRRLENKLGQAEWLSALAYLLGGAYAEKDLHKAWECVLLHQFHDIIPGSSIREVYDDSRIHYGKAEERIDNVIKEALSVMLNDREVSGKKTYAIFSACSFGGRELVHIPEKEEGYFEDQQGNRLEAQKGEDGYAVLVDTVPFGAVNLYFVPDKRDVEMATFALTENGLETPFYSISWNERGQICRLYDKKAKRFVMKEGQLGNVLEFYEDKPMDFEAWDIDLYYTQKAPEIAELIGQPEMMENGNLKAVVRFRYRFRDSEIVQDMIVYKDSRRIDYQTQVDWKETRKLFKVAFTTNIRSIKAAYDIQFGHAERPTHWNTSWDWARFEVCGHKWADLSENGYGVSLLNDCKYGYSVKDNVMKLTLLRSTKFPDGTADLGRHEFIYSLMPHEGSVTEGGTGGTIEEANRLNLPAQVVQGAFSDTRRIVAVSGDMVQMDAIKKAEEEECLIVRLHECRGGRGTVVLSSDFPVRQIVPCNLLEHNCGECIDGNSAEFEIEPFEIKTFKLYL